MGRIFTVPPSPWEQTHAAAILAGVRYQAEHGSLPDTPIWRMLERRREIAPARFDRWHPNVAMMLEGRITLDPPVVPHGWTGHMRHGQTLAPLAVQLDAPVVASAPEPSSAVLWCVVLVVGIWIQRRRD